MKTEESGTLGVVEDPMELVSRTLHSSRNLMMSVRGWAELIQSEGPGRQGEWAEKIVRQVDRLTELYRRVETLCPAPGEAAGSHRLGELLTELVGPRAERVCLELEPGPEQCLVPAELGDAIGALLENALEAGPPSRPISLRLRGLPPRGWELEIRDEGEGMEPEVLRRAGEPFFSRKSGHLGLGLTLCRNVLRRHGMELELSSAPGEGTRARIRRNEDPRGVDR